MQTLYRMFDADGRLLYVGISLNVAQRFALHRTVKPWWNDITTTTMEHFATRAEVLAAEAHAIRTEFPMYNVAGALPVGLTDQTSLAAHDERLAELVAISQRRQEQKLELAELRKEERAAILAAMATGTKQVQICAITGFTREYVRRIERGAESESPATAVEQQERA